MTGHLVASLARRGVEAAHVHIQPSNIEDVLKALPKWGIALMGFTLVLFLFFSSSLEYIIRLVYAHLAMVENPETTVEVHVYEPPTMEDAKIVQNLVEAGLVEPSVLDPEPCVTEKRFAITSSLRRTKLHLTSIAGPKARWRGLPIFILYIVTVGVSGWILKKPLRLEIVPFGNVLVDILSAVFAARIHCAWTHKVISMPSDKKLKERLVSRAQWKELAVPTAMSAGAHGFFCEAVKAMHMGASQACQMLEIQGASKILIFFVAVVPVLIGAAVLALFVLLPAYVSLVRKEASLLAPEEETIVPMDRTFGGRLQFIGDKLNIGDAWNSFTWEARRRLVKLYVKFFFVMIAIGFIFSNLIALEFLLAAGGQVKDIMQELRKQTAL